MPLTPFHLGPAFFLGLLFFRYLDIFALALGSVILDIEPLYNLFQGNVLHGIFHSYLATTIIGIILGIVIFKMSKFIKAFMKIFRLEQKTSLARTIFSCLLGAWSHVFLDSFLYIDMKPLIPLEINPFYGMQSPLVIYSITIISFLLAFLLYILHVTKR